MPKMSEERAEYIAQTLVNESNERQESFEYKDPIKQVGFAQIEHVISFDESLSDGAYRTYAVLISFAQQHDWAIPSVETLAVLRHKDSATISRHLAELQEKKLIDRQRRVGTSSKTVILELPPEYVENAKEILQKRDIAKMQRQLLQKCNVEPRKNAMKRITSEEEQDKEEQTVTGATSSKNAKSNAFTLYENNIGLLTPMVAEEIKEAEKDYPPNWIADAIQEAVLHNARNWKYVSAILKRWKAEGRDNSNGKESKRVQGEPYRHSMTADELDAKLEADLNRKPT